MNGPMLSGTLVQQWANFSLLLGYSLLAELLGIVAEVFAAIRRSSTYSNNISDYMDCKKKHISSLNAAIFHDFGYVWYFMPSLLKIQREKKN